MNFGDRDPQTYPGHCNAALGHGSFIVNTKLLCSFARECVYTDRQIAILSETDTSQKIISIHFHL